MPSDLVKQIGSTLTAIEFLNEFSAIVLPLEYSKEWSYSASQCRTLHNFALPPVVDEAREAEAQRRWRRDERVYLRNGLKVTPRQQQRQRAVLQEAVAIYAQDATEAQKKVMAYLHARSSNQYTAIVRKNCELASAAARKLEDRGTRNQAEMTIKSLLDQSVPFYRPSGRGKSTRLFPLGDSLATLPSSIRRALLGDWYELDLKSAQFAIAAKLWNIDLINDFLRSGGDVWPELIAYFDGQAEKSFLKERVYQVINGGGKRSTMQILDWVVGEGAGAYFFRHPFIAALWKGRAEAFKSIILDRGTLDAFGSRVELEWIDGNRGRRPDLGSVVSQQAQSYELKLLLPVYELAETTDKFSVMLHQHDGLTVAIPDKRREALWLSRIVGAVQAQADALGIHTRLVRTDTD